MLIQPHIGIKQACRAVYALLCRLVLYWHYVPVPVLLYARIGKTPAQYRVVIIVDAFHL